MTMPSANACQTRKINSIYYADGDTRLPKSHDTGSDAAVGRTEQSGFFMLQGPLAINWRAPGYPRIENASLTSDNWGRPDRIRKWLDCNIHVRGRPDWLFVKLHTHGAIERDFDALFGDKAMLMHRELNTAYNDGKRFKLHYVTARQAFNIAKAAEHGKSGDPSNWVDFMLPPQPHHYYTLDAQHDLRCCEPVRLKLASIAGKSDTQLNSRIGGLESLQGIFHAVEASDSVVEIKPVAGHKLLATIRPGYTIERIEGGSVEGGTFPNQRIITGFSESIRLSMNVEGREAA